MKNKFSLHIKHGQLLPDISKNEVNKLQIKCQYFAILVAERVFKKCITLK